MGDSRAITRVLDTFPWAPPTTEAHLLDLDVSFRTDDPVLAQYVASLYEPMRIPDPEAPDEPAAHTLTLVADHARRSFRVHFDARLVVDTASPAIAFAHLLWEANRQAIDATPERVLVHAAGAADGAGNHGSGVLLVGPMGAGKSTLVAGLLASGLRYLTDEVVSIDPGTGLAHPYPKPISLGGPGNPVADALSPVRPDRPADVDVYVGEQWLVPPLGVRLDSIADPAPIRLVVAPRYEPGAPAHLEPLPAPEALMLLAEHTFHLDRHPQVVLDTLAGVVESARCCTLVSGDPADASALIRAELGAEAGS